MKKIIYLLLALIIASVLISFALLIINMHLDDRIYNLFREMRGQAHYEGETRANETWFIFETCLGLVFLLLSCLAYMLNNKSITNRF